MSTRTGRLKDYSIGFRVIMNKIMFFFSKLYFEEGKMVGRVLSYFKILCFINRMDPDEMPHFVQSHPSLYCL